MWKENDKILSICNIVNDINNVLPYKCPVCNNNSVHLYIHSHNKEHSGVWVWCSKCGAYSHMNTTTPIKWENPDFIDSNKLCANPEYLDSLAYKIDEWVMKHMPISDISDNKPVVLENKFNVCFKKNYSTITAGEKGILSIRDDFKTLSISFIDSNNKKINIDLPSEELMQMIEIVE